MSTTLQQPTRSLSNLLACTANALDEAEATFSVEGHDFVLHGTGRRITAMQFAHGNLGLIVSRYTQEAGCQPDWLTDYSMEMSNLTPQSVVLHIVTGMYLDALAT